MDPDYPAAHSMDATWFAVDRDGHVAMFDTGEAGAAPSSAVFLEDATELLRQINQAAPPTEVVYDLQGRLLPGAREVSHDSLRRGDRGGAALFFLKSRDAVQAELQQQRGLEFPALAGHAVALFNPSTALVQQLHQSGNCQACFWYYHPPGNAPLEQWEIDRDVARAGLFSYGHLTENWISGPYGRDKVPRKPLHVDQLPPAARQQVKQMRFDKLCFAETPHIQPTEHDDCVSWEVACLSSDGKVIRPVPGNVTHSDREILEYFQELQTSGLPEGTTIELPDDLKPQRKKQ